MYISLNICNVANDIGVHVAENKFLHIYLLHIGRVKQYQDMEIIIW